ncbi:unnamed protein product [Euphydryas editha]|uniref:Uncharacterized protein n=1 Tax=Euphydryas editha TaxID=104508 RepID=A0AAU9TVC1_EUPED|nr:unnamed protein product [Euphydryas editha]
MLDVTSQAGATSGTRGARVCAHVPRRHTRWRRSGRARRAARPASGRLVRVARSTAAAGEEHRAPHAPACDVSGSMRLPLLPLLVLPLVLVRPAAGLTIDSISFIVNMLTDRFDKKYLNNHV